MPRQETTLEKAKRLRQKPKRTYPPAGPDDLLKGDPIAAWNPRNIAGEEQYIENARKAGTALDASDFHSIGATLALKNLLKRDNEKPSGPVSQNGRPEPIAQLASNQIGPGMIPPSQVEGETVVGLIQMAQNDVDPRVEAVKRIKGMMQPTPQPEVMAPPPMETQHYLQANQLEQQAQPQNVRPQGIKENFIAGIQGAMTPGGFSGMMQNAEAMERQRVQDLLSRAQQLKQQGFQQQQFYQQSENQRLNREFDSEQFKFEKAKQLKAEELANRPRLANIPAGQTYGIEDPTTGNFTPKGQVAPNAATRAPRTVTTEEGVFVLQDDGSLGNRLGDRPRPAAREGEITPNAQAGLVDKLNTRWQKASQDVRDLYRANTIMAAGMDAARKGDLNAGSQAILVTFQKFLDPTSVVRESEYARSPEGISMANRLRGFMERLQYGGAGVPLPELETFARLGQEINSRLAAESESLLSSERQRILQNAQHFQIPPNLIFEDFDFTKTPQNAPPTGGPQVGTVENGYVFQGGDPANPNSWKKQ